MPGDCVISVVRIRKHFRMLPRLQLRTLFIFVGLVPIILAFWVQNATRFGWTTVCEWHSTAPLPGYSMALDRFRAWLTGNSFQKCEAPKFANLEKRHTNTLWFESKKYRDIFVGTSGDQQNVRANVVVRVHDPLFHFRATQMERKDYTDYVSSELHKLWHVGGRVGFEINATSCEP